MAKSRPLRTQNYVKAVTILHGKSELAIAKYIKSNLHLKMELYAKDNGEHSIQITSLMNQHLKKTPFSSMNEFLKKYDVETSGKGNNKKLNEDFKIFIIMDTDDCTEQQKNDFISGEMFNGHWLKPYIVPIYSIPKLDDIMFESKIVKKRIKDSEKGEVYESFFPINKKPLSYDTIQEITTLKSRISPSVKKGDKNLDVFIDYCLSIVKEIKR